MRGLRREQPGLDNVIAELQAGVPVLGAKAAISADVYSNFEKTHALILKIRAARVLVDKAAEVLAESEAYYEDQRESDITLMVTAVRTSARVKDESILASFEKTLAYNAQSAMKAVKTRQKNAKAEAAEAAAVKAAAAAEASSELEASDEDDTAEEEAPASTTEQAPVTVA